MDSLVVLCLREISKSLADINYCSLEELPTNLVVDLVPMLSVRDLAVLHPILQKKGIDVQHQWLKFHREVFKRDGRARQCPCHDPTFVQEDWRQRYLDKICEQKLQEIEHFKPVEAEQQHSIQNQKVQTILQNPLFNPSDDANQKQTPLEGYFPSSLRLESRLLPHIQTNPIAMQSLQRNLRELVLSHYLPKYKQVLRKILDHLIHHGVLRKFTLKHPKCLTPKELLSILEVCAGRYCEVDGDKRRQDDCERRKSSKRKSNNEISSPETKQGDSKKEKRLEQGRLLGVLPHKEQPEQGDVSVDNRQDLYDFCFSEPVGKASDSPAVSNMSLPACLGLHPPDSLHDEGRDADFVTPRSGFPFRGQHTDGHPQDETPDGDTICPQCGQYRTTAHCIQHLVLCGFMLQQSEYSDMLQTVLSTWPSLRELEFLDNLMFGDASQKLCEALIQGQCHTHSLRRLRIEENSVHDCNLPLLKHLVLSTELEILELHTTDLEFCNGGQTRDGIDVQHPLYQLEEAFSQLSVVKLSNNKLSSLTCLERALLQPDCAITHLALDSCQLNTEMLDSLFLSVKDSRCLCELNVNFNTYTPSQCSQLAGLVQLVQCSKLTKLDLVHCRFALQGWTHANDFVKALRNNRSLRQICLSDNLLTDWCLLLFSDVFISHSSNNNAQGPRLCLDISGNSNITYKGLEAFGRVLHKASTAPGCLVNPPRHLMTSIKKHQHPRDDSESLRLAKIFNMTFMGIENVQPRFARVGNNINFRDLMAEHLSQM